MNQELFWPRLKYAFGNQKVFWSPDELQESPGVTDRLIHYLISYYETPSIARNAIRIFRGITQEFEASLFCGWNEVRVSSIREIDDALRLAGARGASWQLALTIKDFLQNLWTTLDTVDLNDVSTENSSDVVAYIKQLQGIENSWFVPNDKGKPTAVDTPVRSKETLFYKHFKRYRSLTEPVLPNCAVEYLEYLWKRTRRAPFDYHADRILARFGVFEPGDPIATKTTRFEGFTTESKPFTKHKHLVQLGKVVCFVKNPRCEICPVSDLCAKKHLK